MSHSTIPLARAWNTWTGERPAEMVYLPLGIRVTPIVYASSSGEVNDFAPGQNVELGPRAIDGRQVELRLNHAATHLAWSYHKPDPFTLCGGWRTERLGEWGLRFWVMLCFHTDGNHVWRYHTDRGELSLELGHRRLLACCQNKPLLATFHDGMDDLKSELRERGYFYLGSRGTEGTFAALRFNLEEASENRFAIAMADASTIARQQAAATLTQDAGATLSETGSARAAVRDVVAWNTVWDDVNGRPYTALSRHWDRQKFGGFGVWLNDLLYHALLAAPFDPQLTRENLAAVLAGLTPQGNLPCLITANDAWVDRSQPPIASFIFWLIHCRLGEPSLLELGYPALYSNHQWWWRERDKNADGLVEYGTSEVGCGLYIGTKLAAKDESSMDNSPVHDQTSLDPKTRTLDCNDVGLNSLLALDGEMLARIARVLGDSDAAVALESRAAELKTRIRDHLWDDDRGVFANRLWNGEFVQSLAPTSFYPLLAGAANQTQAKALVDDYLLNANEFGGDWMLPAVSRSDPAFADNVYWRGRIWPPLNFLTYYGLKRHGFDQAASQLADNGYRLFAGAWQQRHCPENFNADSGEALDQPDTDPFYTWGALLPYLAMVDAAGEGFPDT